jgi:hypothetical protein
VETAPPAPTESRTVFRAFVRGEFIDWPSWVRLSAILRSNGGSFGLCGPRGAGKSWLMLRAIDDVRRKRTEIERSRYRRLFTPPGRRRYDRPDPGIGLWYPSPSEYDPHAFLASLSHSLANEIERRFRKKHPVQDFLLSSRTVTYALPVAVAASTFVVVAQIGLVPETWNIAWAALGAAAAGVAARYLLRLPFVARRSYRQEARLLREAAIIRERARYTTTQREGTEVGAEAGKGVAGTIRASRERELQERPATLSTLVNDFRALAEQAGEVCGNVVIAIDELDKMSDPAKVHDLLRDIKGIFDIPAVHFLVSVSDEAARSLNLGALTERDVFNSSFYTVLELPHAAPEACAELLQRRADVPRDVAVVLAVLAGGNPRELLRLAELVGDVETGAAAAVKVLRAEALSLRRDIVTASATDGASLGQDARVAAFQALRDENFDAPALFVDLAGRALDDALWSPPWADGGFHAAFDEAWRRLMLRLAVAGELVANPSLVTDRERPGQLQEVVIAASQSAWIARIVLERRLSVEVRTTVEQSDVRRQVDDLAAEYDATRRTQPPGHARTQRLDEIVSRARELVPDAAFDAAEIAEMLRSKEGGRRIVALAAVAATPDPASLDAVLEAIHPGATPFESYHALRALESMRPSLSPEQRRRAIDLLSENSFLLAIGEDGARRSLAERILRGLKDEATLGDAAA